MDVNKCYFCDKYKEKTETFILVLKVDEESAECANVIVHKNITLPICNECGNKINIKDVEEILRGVVKKVKEKI